MRAPLRWAMGGLAGALLGGAVLAQDGSAPVTIGEKDAHGWIRGDVAVLRGLDKITAETRDFEVRLGEQVQFGALTIVMPAPCGERPPEETPETVAGLEVYERQTDGQGREVEPRQLFSGWMFASSPALNPLEHGVYDVWVVDCRVAATPAPQIR